MVACHPQIRAGRGNPLASHTIPKSLTPKSLTPGLRPMPPDTDQDRGRSADIQLLEYPIPLSITKSVRWRYLGNQAWYQRSTGVKTTGKIQKKTFKKNISQGP